MLERGQTVVWLTPPEILSVLGRFDLDPCAAPPPRPWATANHHFDGFNYDGLKEPWLGRVWMNPPYTGDRTAVKGSLSPTRKESRANPARSFGSIRSNQFRIR
jgi:hypothetical protein